MKFRLIEKEKDVKSINKIDKYLVIEKNDYKYHRIQYLKEIIFEDTFEPHACVMSIEKGRIIISNYPRILFFDLKTKKLLREIKVQLLTIYGTFDLHENNLILYERYEFNKPGDLICKDIDNLEVKWQIKDISIKIGEIYQINKSLVIVNDKMNLIQSIDTEKGEINWQFDISQFGPYRNWDYIKREWQDLPREIERVYYYNDKIIVTLSRAVIALNPHNGQLLWKVDLENFNPCDVIFKDNIAFIGELLYFVKIDTDKGIKIFERFDPKYNFIVEGNKLTQITYQGMTFYKDYLWLARNFNGREFLLKVNPLNGDILEGRLLDTNYTCYPPLFYDNRMYIHDQVWDLYVYEEIEEGQVIEEEKEEEEEEVFTQVLDIKGEKHILIYSETWNKELEDKLEEYLKQYWVQRKMKRADEVRFVFKHTRGISADTLYDEMIKFLDCDRIRSLLSAIPAENVRLFAGEDIHPEYQPYFLVKYFREKEHFDKIFRVE